MWFKESNRYVYKILEHSFEFSLRCILENPINDEVDIGSCKGFTPSSKNAIILGNTFSDISRYMTSVGHSELNQNESSGMVVWQLSIAVALIKMPCMM